MTKQDSLDRIRTDIIEQNICPDLVKTAKQIVFGSGNIDTDVVFIGEAPGKKEDEIGEPFVGASGKLLDQMLESINLQRSDIYITNIVKYRPPNNRDPLPEEKSAFLPYLYSQLVAIKPKVIVTLGRHSTNCFLPGLQIGEIHGQAQRISIKNQESRIQTGKYRELSLIILPLYHPAAALYNGKLRQTLINDFKVIPQLIKNTK